MSRPYVFSQGLVWDVNTLTWVKAVQASGGGGGGGDVNITNSSIAVTGPLTDTQLRASAVPISGTVTANAGSGTFAVSGPLTDTQLRATAVPVSGTITATGPLTDTQLRATAVPVSGPATDAQLRAVPLPVSGTFWQSTQPVSVASMPSTPVTGTFWQSTQPVSIATAPVLVAGSAIIGKTGIDQTTDGTTNKVYVGNVPHVIVDTAPTTAVTGPLTDTQLRAVAVPVSGTVTATGPLTDTQLRNSAVPVSGTFWQSTQPVSGTVTVTQGTASSLKVDLSGTSANPTAIKVDGSAVTQPVSLITLPLPSGAATEGTLANILAATSTASVVGLDASVGYTAGNSNVLTQSTDGRLRTVIAGIVDDSPSSNLTVGSATTLSVTTDGRLRVASVDASVFLEQFHSDNPFFDSPRLTSHDNPWALDSLWD